MKYLEKDEDDDRVHRLTDIEVVKIDYVDHPANGVKFLVMKKDKSMKVKKEKTLDFNGINKEDVVVPEEQGSADGKESAASQEDRPDFLKSADSVVEKLQALTKDASDEDVAACFADVAEILKPTEEVEKAKEEESEVNPIEAKLEKLADGIGALVSALTKKEEEPAAAKEEPKAEAAVEVDVSNLQKKIQDVEKKYAAAAKQLKIEKSKAKTSNSPEHVEKAAPKGFSWPTGDFNSRRNVEGNLIKN